MSKDLEVVIGIEIHVQLKTKSKLFCSCSTEFGSDSNINTCPVCLAMPGALPVLNKKAVELAVRTGKALNCKINARSEFSRKNYFYPDSPKGYQISQFELPICGKGSVEIILEDGSFKKIGITRAHLEEDAGKSSHESNFTYVNLNRCSVPLLEIVSDPELHSPYEASSYVKTIRDIVRSLGVCDGNLEEGSLRADCNISLRPKGQKEFGTRVELKNINSFRFIEKALEYEIERQKDLIYSNQTDKIVQETRLYDSTKNKTYTMRSKEEAEDYRYFPDPDLYDCVVDEEVLQKIANETYELPIEKFKRYHLEFGLSKEDSQNLCSEKEIANYFEETVKSINEPKLVSNWILTEVFRRTKEDKINIDELKVSPKKLSEILSLISKNEISIAGAKKVFNAACDDGSEIMLLLEKLGLKQDNDEESIKHLVLEIIENSPKQVNEYKSGKDKVFSYFVGNVMKLSKGKANPDIVRKILLEELKEL